MKPSATTFAFQSTPPPPIVNGRNTNQSILRQQLQQQQLRPQEPKRSYRSYIASRQGSAQSNDVNDERILVDQFVSRLLDSLRSKQFVSIIFFGHTRKKKQEKKNFKSNPILDEKLRGSIREVHGRLIQIKKHGELLQFTIKYHGATDICKNLKFDQLSTKLTKMMLNAETLASEWGIESMKTSPIRYAELKTTSAVYELQLNQESPASKSTLNERKVKTKQSASNPTSHDRTKEVPISTKSDFLQALGLTNKEGKPKQGMKSKLRQCQKFVEIVSNLVDKVHDVDEDDSPSNGKQIISVTDMGCGRGYLTFALHQYLSEKYNDSTQQVKVKSKGIDVRPKLVNEINGISQSLGGYFEDNLLFEQGTIEDILKGSALEKKVDSLEILIALHACDTATDDALWSGICRNVDIIVVAPCCHKEIRSQVDQFHVQESKLTTSQQHPLLDVLKHGIYRERLSESVTDSLRALLLELAGYKVQVFEFIGGEHTSKNVMITAIKNKKDTSKDKIRERIHNLADFHGIHKQKLAEWMGESIAGGMNGASSKTSSSNSIKKSTARLAQMQMPAPARKE